MAPNAKAKAKVTTPATEPTAAPTAISLFSGCGGDTLGMENAGFKVVAFNEFNKAAIQTHMLNFPNSVLLKDDNITDITKLPDTVFEPYKNTIDLVFAGFPCQGFSSAGKRKAADPRNQMYHQFVRAVRSTKPKFFIGENVTGLVSMKSGPKESDPLVLTLIKQAFSDIGYDLTYQVLEATDFGVPQKRKRIVLVGWDKSRYPQFDAPGFWANLTTAKKTLPKLRSFVTASMDGAFKIPSSHIPVNFEQYALPIAQDAEPEGQAHPYVALKSTETKTDGDKEYTTLLSCSKRDSPYHSEVISLDHPSKTIICTYDHQPRLLVGLKKPDGTAYVRTLLPDELKQIQGFPGDYKLTGNKKEKVVQVGNAVPPPMIQAVATRLKLLL